MFCKTIPTEKAGTDTPHRAKPIKRWSAREFFLMAEIMPAGMPMIQDKAAAVTASIKVFGNALAIREDTLRISL